MSSFPRCGTTEFHNGVAQMSPTTELGWFFDGAFLLFSHSLMRSRPRGSIFCSDKSLPIRQIPRFDDQVDSIAVLSYLGGSRQAHRQPYVPGRRHSFHKRLARIGSTASGMRTRGSGSGGSGRRRADNARVDGVCAAAAVAHRA